MQGVTPPILSTREKSMQHSCKPIAEHPPEIGSGQGRVDGDKQPKQCHPSVIISRKTLSLEEKNAMTKCKPLNICLLRTFLVLSHTTTLSRKIDSFNLKTAQI